MNFKPNLIGIALIAVGFLLLDGAVNSRSPLDVAKAILTGKKPPEKGSGVTKKLDKKDDKNTQPPQPGPNGNKVPIPKGSPI